MGFAIDRVEKGRVDERFLPRNVRDARLLWYHGEQLVGGAVFLCREVIDINYELLGHQQLVWMFYIRWMESKL